MDAEWIIVTVVWAFVLAAKIVGCALVLALGWFVRHEWPAFHEAVADGVRERPGLSLCAGVLAQLALAIVTVVLALTIVGIPLAIVLVTMAVLVAGLGLATVAELVGARLPLPSLAAHPERQLVMGVIVVLALSMVPLLGDALLVGAITVGSGAIAMAILGGFSRHAAHPESVITY
jgi:hypothetical protein